MDSNLRDALAIRLERAGWMRPIARISAMAAGSRVLETRPTACVVK